MNTKEKKKISNVPDILQHARTLFSARRRERAGGILRILRILRICRSISVSVAQWRVIKNTVSRVNERREEEPSGANPRIRSNPIRSGSPVELSRFESVDNRPAINTERSLFSQHRWRAVPNRIAGRRTREPKDSDGSWTTLIAEERKQRLEDREREEAG